MTHADASQAHRTPAAWTLSKLLVRQMRRHLGVDSPQALEQLLQQLQRASAAEPGLVALAQGLSAWLNSVADSYAQYERDLSLRTRSLELSSAELFEANERLRRDSEAQAQRSRSQLERAIAALDAGFAMYDADERLLVWNQRFADMYGTVGQRLRSGMPLTELLGAIFDSGVEEIPADVSREAWIADRVQWKRRGGARESLINGRWMRVVDSRTDDGLLVTLRTDVTDMRELADRLAQARDAAEAASLAKSQFLANMSHEIRTPMNGIIGMTGLALDTDLTPEQREYLSLVKTSADALLVIINDILDFSKMEAGMLRVDSLGFSLDALLGDTLKALGVRAFGKGLELLYRRQADVPDRVVGDPGRLRQIINNLVGNAIKFTDRGEIAVEVACVRKDASHATLRFSVSDTGMGIAGDKQGLIFAAFSQADSSITRRYGGTGLGLAICSRLVDLMGGRIGVDSEPGRGSRFHFELTLPYEPEAPRASPDTLPAWSVLVIDDNMTHGAWLSDQLRQWGMQVQTASGFDQARVLLQGDLPCADVVLLDAQMPGVDGFELLRRLQHVRWLAPRTVVMLSADNLLSDVARCKTLGVAGYVSKPVAGLELRQALMSIQRPAQAPRGDQPSAPPAAASPGQPRSLDVLLVEDNEINQTLATFLLERMGHAVTVAANGRLAVEMTAAKRYDLVLMDMQMPEMDGLEATRCIRQREAVQGGHVPIMAMTANAMQGDRERCLAAGMDGYVSKPIDGAALGAEVERVLAPAAAAPSQAPVRASATVPASRPLQDERAVFDLGAVMQRLGTSRDSALEMARLFVGDAATLLQRIRAANAHRDLGRVATLSRRLLHAADSLSAAHVRRLAHELMQAANGHNEAAIDQLVGQLDQAMVRFARVLMSLPTTDAGLAATPVDTSAA